MDRFTKVTLNVLLVGVCVVSTAGWIAVASSSVEAVPRTTGKPGRLEPGGRRAVHPKHWINPLL